MAGGGGWLDRNEGIYKDSKGSLYSYRRGFFLPTVGLLFLVGLGEPTSLLFITLVEAS